MPRLIAPTLDERINALPHPRVLLLSGGGGNGAAEAGALVQFYLHGYRPDLIVGTSIGAWNAAFLASHNDLAGAQQLAEHWRRGVFAGMAIPRFRDLGRYALGRTPSPMGPDVLDPVEAQLGLSGLRWDQLQVPLVMGAVEPHSGALTYWDKDRASGLVMPYVRASSGLTPLQPLGAINGHQMADAGFKDNYGIREAVRQLDPGAGGSLLVLDAAPRAADGAIVTPRQGMNLALGLVFGGRLAEDVDAARGQGFQVDVVPLGGDHSVLNYWDPSAGLPVGAQAAHDWACGVERAVTWPRQSTLRRVATAATLVGRTVQARHDLAVHQIG